MVKILYDVKNFIRWFINRVNFILIWIKVEGKYLLRIMEVFFNYWVYKLFFYNRIIYELVLMVIIMVLNCLDVVLCLYFNLRGY